MEGCILDWDAAANIWWHLWSGSLTRCLQPSQERSAAPYHSHLFRNRVWTSGRCPAVQGQGASRTHTTAFMWVGTLFLSMLYFQKLEQQCLDGLLTTNQHWQMKMWLSSNLYSACYGAGSKETLESKAVLDAGASLPGIRHLSGRSLWASGQGLRGSIASTPPPNLLNPSQCLSQGCSPRGCFYSFQLERNLWCSLRRTTQKASTQGTPHLRANCTVLSSYWQGREAEGSVWNACHLPSSACQPAHWNEVTLSLDALQVSAWTIPQWTLRRAVLCPA